MRESAPARLPDEIIVKYKSLNRFAEHGQVLRRMGRHAEVLRHDGGKFRAAGADRWAALQEKIRKIKKDSNVLYAEPNYLGRFDETLPPAPNDPSYTSQWWLPAVGDSAMWALGRGEGVIVAVIDTGADLSHPDLAANLLANGYNFGDGNAVPQDKLGHGTRVAGVIAAQQNNALGVSGLAPSAKMLPIKINPGAEGTFTSDRLASAIGYAVGQGAKIINLSLTVDNETQMVREAVQAALDAGVAVVAATGNEGGAVAFPANMPGVIGVAATAGRSLLSVKVDSGGTGYAPGDTIVLSGGEATVKAVVTVNFVDALTGAVIGITITTPGLYLLDALTFTQFSTSSGSGSGVTFKDGVIGNTLASFSNSGTEVTVAAPGVNIYSTGLNGGYGSSSGTSFAAPIISAILANVISINPSLPPSGFAGYLRANTKSIGGGTYTYGTVDAGKTANSLIPHLLLGKQQFSSLESLPVNFTLPPTGGAVDVFVALQTQDGEYALHPDGHWTPVTETGYVPFAVGYSAAATLSGTLFGSGGLFPPISLGGVPVGTYTWRTALVGSASHKIVGDVITTTMSLGN